MKNIRIFLSLTVAILVMIWSSVQVSSQSIESTSEILLRSEVEWSPLNPARGDASPKAGTLWGDRTSSGASGFLVRFEKGFSSPPHIHNVTYKGVVISGLVHNDDPNAENMWMPVGSFWTQPAGEAHITSAEGKANVAYIEIEEGPYLVLPEEEAFDNGERPVNVDASNVIWLDASNINWINLSGIAAFEDEPEIAFLWGKPQDGELNGTLLKLPAGFRGEIRNYGSIFRAVVIQGQLQISDEAENKILAPGSYFGSKGKSVYQVSSDAQRESIIYIRTEGKFDIISLQFKK